MFDPITYKTSRAATFMVEANQKQIKEAALTAKDLPLLSENYPDAVRNAIRGSLFWMSCSAIASADIIEWIEEQRKDKSLPDDAYSYELVRHSDFDIDPGPCPILKVICKPRKRAIHFKLKFSNEFRIFEI